MSETKNVVEQFYYNHTEKGYFTNATPVDYHHEDKNEDGTPFVMPPPYRATLKPIPKVPERKWPKLVNDEWVLVDNWVGFTYWLADRTTATITEFEVTPPEGYLTEDPGPTLDDLKKAQIRTLLIAYRAATYANIEFTNAAGIKAVYQADENSLAKMDASLASFAEVPEGYFWLDVKNSRIPFTRGDLLALRSAIATRDFTLFTKYQDYKAEVTLATSKDQPALVVWED